MGARDRGVPPAAAAGPGLAVTVVAAMAPLVTPVVGWALAVWLSGPPD